MAQLVRRALVTDPLPREVALQIAQGIYATDAQDFARGIERYVQARLRIVDEFDELLIDPVVLLQQMESPGFDRPAGDCDDAATVIATLLLALGIPARFKAILRDRIEGHYRHVFAEYKQNGAWVPVDPTLPFYPVYAPGDFIIEEI
jgi:transglutaminase-like putative cysteine protease